MAEGKHAKLKEKAKEELRLLLIITAYLGILFCVFLSYRRLISRELGVTVFHYGFALLEALVIAKVILIGKAIGLEKKGSASSLFLASLRAALVYGLLIAVFAVLEHVVGGLIHGKGFAAGLQELAGEGVYEILARALVLTVALIPFFAIWKLNGALGEKKLSQIFFGKGSPPQAGG